MPMQRILISLLLLICSAAWMPVRAEDAIERQAIAVVVSADGYLLAYSGVMHDASKINATIAGKTFPVTIVKTDEARKLTLLKVQATELCALPLAQDTNGYGTIAGYPTDPFIGTMLKTTQTWYYIIDTPAQKPAVLVYRHFSANTDGYFLLSPHGELAGMLVNNYWPDYHQPWQTPELPASEMLPLLTSAGVKMNTPAPEKPNPATPATRTRGTRRSRTPMTEEDLNKIKPAFALLTIWSTHSTRRVNAKDHAVLAEVPAGEFTMGSSKEDQPMNNTPQYVGIFPDELPRHKVTLDTFWIYKYEVTVGQYRQFCTETNRSMPALPIWEKDDVPIINVTWQDAQDYAHWAGAVLPTEAQYEKASRGTDARLYPWGSPNRPGWTGEHYSEAYRRSSSGAQSVGSSFDGPSPYGVVDLVGNVWQWCADWYQADYYQHSPANNPTGPVTGSERVIRGGSWFNEHSEDFRSTARAHIAPEQHNYFTGFRCVVVKP